MPTQIKDVKLKKIIKSAVLEALEDFALGKAMEEAENDETVSEKEIMKILKKKENTRRI